jgi:hypothetical protein
VSGETIRLSIILRLVVDFVRVTYIKDTQMLVFNFIFDLLWTGRGSLLRTVAFMCFRELK